MSIPFLDLKSPHLELEEELVQTFRDCLRNAAFVGGPQVQAFEEEFGRFCGTKHAIAVNSGTDALRFALMAAGIGPGDEVITVPNTFIATVEAISQAGATPVFVDVDERTSNMDPARLEDYLRNGSTAARQHGSTPARSRAVMPVHLYGQPADMDAIFEIAGRFGLVVIEDACQAHGALHQSKAEVSGRSSSVSRVSCVLTPDSSSSSPASCVLTPGSPVPGPDSLRLTPDSSLWRRAGSMGLAAGFSFYPGKNLGACGEGGAATTDDDGIAKKIRMLRDHGQAQKYYHDFEGYNGRLDTVQCGILRSKLRRLEAWNNQRREAAGRYGKLLAGIPGVTLPHEPSWAKGVYHLYVIRAARRDELQKFLNEKGIGTGLHYPVPLHLQKAYGDRGWKTGDFPVTERLASELLSLPMFPGITSGQQAEVASALRGFYGV
jgi:dTDP-4-amino-4,6-dideoxygalactose transaminase